MDAQGLDYQYLVVVKGDQTKLMQ
jgi:hypothetical protein